MDCCFALYISRIIFQVLYGGHSSAAERLVVAQEVEGSNPSGHPIKFRQFYISRPAFFICKNRPFISFSTLINRENLVSFLLD